MIDNGGDDGACGGVLVAIKLLIDVMRKGRRSKNEKKKSRCCCCLLSCVCCLFKVSCVCIFSTVAVIYRCKQLLQRPHRGEKRRRRVCLLFLWCNSIIQKKYLQHCVLCAACSRLFGSIISWVPS